MLDMCTVLNQTKGIFKFTASKWRHTFVLFFCDKLHQQCALDKTARIEGGDRGRGLVSSLKNKGEVVIQGVQ